MDLPSGSRHPNKIEYIQSIEKEGTGVKANLAMGAGLRKKRGIGDLCSEDQGDCR
jgi:hypothetical protein